MFWCFDVIYSNSFETVTSFDSVFPSQALFAYLRRMDWLNQQIRAAQKCLIIEHYCLPCRCWYSPCMGMDFVCWGILCRHPRSICFSPWCLTLLHQVDCRFRGMQTEVRPVQRQDWRTRGADWRETVDRIPQFRCGACWVDRASHQKIFLWILAIENILWLTFLWPKCTFRSSWRDPAVVQTIPIIPQVTAFFDTFPLVSYSGTTTPTKAGVTPHDFGGLGVVV